MKIKTIKIHNYRAFYPQYENQTPKPYEIAINGKNVLIYGENGSGKTSLFRAVRDFIMSSHRNITFERNSFTPVLQGSIQDGEVMIEFDNLQSFTFKSIAPLTNTNLSANLILAEKASGWLTYTEILKTYLVDKGKPDLFNLLIGTILWNHILPPSSSRTIGEEWTILEKNINEFRGNSFVKTLLKNGKLNCDTLNIGLTYLLKGRIITNPNNSTTNIIGIEAILNDWLKRYFKNGLEIEFNFLEVREARDDTKAYQKRFLQKSLTLDITLNGRTISKQEYQEILNEARLSALAIGVFLAAYKIYQTDTIPTKILYLDDVFIGLDMSNRLPLLEIIEKEFITDGYQVFVSTYDRAWFELAKNKLKSWKTIEMYAGDDDIPVIIPDDGNVKKADAYFKAKDYMSAGNLLRKEVEKLIFERLPITYRYDKNGIPISELDRLINQLNTYYEESGCKDLFTPALNQNLKMFKDIVLNPSSHYDLQSPIYKVEVEKAFDVVNSLSTLPIIERQLLLGMGSTLFYKNTGSVYRAEYVLTENIYKITIPHQAVRITDAKHILLRFTHNGTPNNGNSEKILLSKRPAKIETYLHLVNNSIMWQSDFLTTSNENLTTLATK